MKKEDYQFVDKFLDNHNCRGYGLEYWLILFLEDYKKSKKKKT